MIELVLDGGRSNETMIQPSIDEALLKRKIWDINNPQAQRKYVKLTQMIASGNHPFSIVEEDGFINYTAELEPRLLLPSRRYISDNMLPLVYDQVIL